ncbi:hypothetical protein CPB85DRAFT_1376778 [Mucidula mucida]|nr:hypothetical protein CPB85DRAFT_1376778 [Mucidula mucida]
MLPPRAYIFIGLNGVRVLSIIALLLVFSSNIVTLVHDVQAVNKFLAAGEDKDLTDCDYIEGSTVPNQAAGIFWAVLNRLLIIFQTVFLILSEVGWPASFFQRFFPILGEDFGLGALGIIQCLIGAAILSHHVDDFTLVSAFFLFAIGCLNIFLGLIFRQGAKSKRSVTSWRDHAKSAAKSALPTHVAGIPVPTAAAASFVSKAFSHDEEKNSSSPSPSFKSSLGFGRQGEKAAGLKGYLISKPMESLPRYAPKPAGNA